MATTKSNSGANIQGVIMPLLIIGGGGVAVWQLSKYFKDQQQKKEDKERQQNIIKLDASIQKTQEKINALRQKAFVSGVNGYGETETTNFIDTANDVIRTLYNVIKLQSGKTIYKLKEPKNVRFGEAYYYFMINPLKVMPQWLKVYTAYTGSNFLDDFKKYGDAQSIANINAALKVSRKQYPAQWKKGI